RRDGPGVPGRRVERKGLARRRRTVRMTVPWPAERSPPTRGRRTLLAINNVPIEDTFAEAFPMTAARLVVTAETPGWARTAGQVTTGYAASVIGCDAEAGIERVLPPEETPDARPGVSLLLFAFSREALQKAVIN